MSPVTHATVGGDPRLILGAVHSAVRGLPMHGSDGKGASGSQPAAGGISRCTTFTWVISSRSSGP